VVIQAAQFGGSLEDGICLFWGQYKGASSFDLGPRNDASFRVWSSRDCYLGHPIEVFRNALGDPSTSFLSASP
jgi:hypothetical protein